MDDVFCPECLMPHNECECHCPDCGNLNSHCECDFRH